MKGRLTMVEVEPKRKPSRALLKYLAENWMLLQTLEEVTAGKARFLMKVRYGAQTKRQRW